MLRRIVLFGAMAAIVVAALVSALAVMDVITLADLTSTLGRTILVVVIATTTVVLLTAAGKASTSPDHGAPRSKP
jgi:hypothetical protein